MAKAKTKRPRQQRLPEMEQEGNPAVEAVAHEYWETMTERCRLSKEEDEVKETLRIKMEAAGLTRYETADGFIVTLLDLGNKVKMKKAKDAEPSENGDGEE